MAPEPPHLTGIVKYCHRCGSTDVKYAYDNNGKREQPRYKCLNQGCSALFTYGGKCRGPYRVKHPQVPGERLPSNRTGVVNDRSRRIAKHGVAGDDGTGIAKLDRGALSPGARSNFQVVPRSEPFEVGKILDEDLVGVIGSAAIGGVRTCLSRASSAKSELLHGMSKSGYRSAAGSSAGVVIVDQCNASKAVQEGAEAKVELVKAILGIPPYGLVPVVESKQVKRIRVKHQEREFIIEYFT